jgi:hypothetical protein
LQRRGGGVGVASATPVAAADIAAAVTACALASALVQAPVFVEPGAATGESAEALPEF